jgi:hypothetical protein
VAASSQIDHTKDMLTHLRSQMADHKEANGIDQRNFLSSAIALIVRFLPDSLQYIIARAK